MFAVRTQRLSQQQQTEQQHMQSSIKQLNTQNSTSQHHLTALTKVSSPA